MLPPERYPDVPTQLNENRATSFIHVCILPRAWSSTRVVSEEEDTRSLYSGSIWCYRWRLRQPAITKRAD